MLCFSSKNLFKTTLCKCRVVGVQYSPFIEEGNFFQNKVQKRRLLIFKFYLDIFYLFQKLCLRLSFQYCMLTLGNTFLMSVYRWMAFPMSIMYTEGLLRMQFDIGLARKPFHNFLYHLDHLLCSLLHFRNTLQKI